MDLTQNWQGIEMLLVIDISQVLDFSWNTLSLSPTNSLRAKSNCFISADKVRFKSSHILFHLALLFCSMHKATSSTQTHSSSSEINDFF